MKRKSFDQAICPIARSLDAVGDWWSLLIVRDALAGIRRFSDFQKHLGMAKNILTLRLRRLVELGIMETAPVSEGGAYKEYTLTEKGLALLPVIIALRQWGLKTCFAEGETYELLVDAKDGLPLADLVVQSHDHRPLTTTDMRLKRAVVGQPVLPSSPK